MGPQRRRREIICPRRYLIFTQASKNRSRLYLNNKAHIWDLRYLQFIVSFYICTGKMGLICGWYVCLFVMYHIQRIYTRETVSAKKEKSPGRFEAIVSGHQSITISLCLDVRVKVSDIQGLYIVEEMWIAAHLKEHFRWILGCFSELYVACSINKYFYSWVLYFLQNWFLSNWEHCSLKHETSWC